MSAINTINEDYQEIKLINRERGYNLCLIDLNEVLRAVLTSENVKLINQINELMALSEEVRKGSGYNDSKD